ncbi:hypothetical protein JOC34_000440 [Virgibacillus halotolerans]|nr:hypothetical protein [Virgibacillus halotolerans]MBM7598083.1 hypothetical protein [Virgibacillus halotolerans]
MQATAHDTRVSQSNSFLKLRHKMQTQMKKKNVTYEDVLKWTKDIKDGK